MRSSSWSVALLAVAVACGGSSSSHDAAPSPIDAGPEAAPPVDAAPDAAPPEDAAPDAAPPLDAAPIAELTRVDAEPPGRHCRFGGTAIATGLDDGGSDGAGAADGILDADEIDAVRYTCAEAPPTPLAATGLDQLTATTCRPSAGTGNRGVVLTPAFPAVRFPDDPDCHAGVNDVSCSDAFRPMALRQQPGTGRFFVAQQNGRILAFAPGDTAAVVVLDLTPQVVWGYEPGLLQFDLDPRAPADAYITYVTCAAATIGPGGPTCADGEQADVRTVVVRYTLGPDGRFDPASATAILDVAHPATEHNGGGAQFGPDGLLYVALGDGGAFPATAPRRLDSLLGKLLRLDVHAADGGRLPAGTPYRIPADNPHVGVAGARGEIFARGLRNPWRFDVSVDLGRPQVWLADVGLVTAEELDLVEAGDDLGWPDAEGPYCRTDPTRVTVDPLPGCTPPGKAPIAWYRQAEGVSITGGVLYRGRELAGLRGAYLFADFTTGAISALQFVDGAWRRQHVATTARQIVGFARDLTGEVYVLDWWTGAIDRLTTSAAAPATAPPRLSDTGCVDPTDPHRPAPGAIPYDVNAPLIDGDDVYKERWLYLSGEAQLLEWSTSGVINATPGAVLVKHFDIGARRVETRIMALHDDWTWSFTTYRWLPDGSDAIRVDAGITELVDGQPWRYPERGECQLCHGDGRPLGLRVEQLNGAIYYPSTDRFANQLETLGRLGRLNRLNVPGFTVGPLPSAPTLPRRPGYRDTSAPVAERVAGFLASNCAHCHRPAGAGRGAFDLGDPDTACEALPASEVYDDPTLRVVKPGDPARSMLWRRLVEDELPYRMPFGRQRRDTLGPELVAAWIVAMSSCD